MALCVLLEHPKNNVSQVLQQMEAIRNLHGMRRCPPRRFGVLATTIPAHHLYSRMLRESQWAKVSALRSGRTSTSV